MCARLKFHRVDAKKTRITEIKRKSRWVWSWIFKKYTGKYNQILQGECMPFKMQNWKMLQKIIQRSTRLFARSRIWFSRKLNLFISGDKRDRSTMKDVKLRIGSTNIKSITQWTKTSSWVEETHWGYDNWMYVSQNQAKRHATMIRKQHLATTIGRQNDEKGGGIMPWTCPNIRTTRFYEAFCSEIIRNA